MATAITCWHFDDTIKAVNVITICSPPARLPDLLLRCDAEIRPNDLPQAAMSIGTVSRTN